MRYQRFWAKIAALPFVFSLGSSATLAQQETRATALLPDAPTPQQGPSQVPQESRSGRFKSTLEIVRKRSVFFPELAFQKGSLSSQKKLELAIDEGAAPSRLIASALTSGVSQARNSLAGYGQEAGGYAKRYGSSLATNASSHIFGTFLLPSALRQDPRYFVMLHGSSANRVIYALERVVVTRTDRGTTAINWSGVLGSLMAESLANSYLPDNERTTGRTFRRFAIRVSFSAASNIVREYWPTVFKNLRMEKFMPAEQSDPGTVTPPSSPKPWISRVTMPTPQPRVLPPEQARADSPRTGSR
jgi:hypothetical protein